jgi:S-adenosylmethionine decarboxylase
MTTQLTSMVDTENVSIHADGLHIIANLTSSKTSLLSDFKAYKILIDGLINSFCLTKIGEVYNNFENGGFTGVVCLSESHLSIHTWPEKNYITFDVFLSNFRNDNSLVTRTLYAQTVAFFSASILAEETLKR